LSNFIKTLIRALIKFFFLFISSLGLAKEVIDLKVLKKKLVSWLKEYTSLRLLFKSLIFFYILKLILYVKEELDKLLNKFILTYRIIKINKL